jgi:hypothetical protein
MSLFPTRRMPRRIPESPALLFRDLQRDLRQRQEQKKANAFWESGDEGIDS